MADRLLPDLYSSEWASDLGSSGPSPSGPDDDRDRVPFGPPSPFDDTDAGRIDYTDEDRRGGDERPPLPNRDDSSPGLDAGKLIEAGIKGAIDIGRTTADAVARERESERKAEAERDRLNLQREALDRKERQLDKEREERERRRLAEEQAAKERAEDRAWRERTPDRREPAPGDTPPTRREPPDSYREQLNDRVRAALKNR